MIGSGINNPPFAVLSFMSRSLRRVHRFTYGTDAELSEASVNAICSRRRKRSPRGAVVMMYMSRVRMGRAESADMNIDGLFH